MNLKPKTLGYTEATWHGGAVYRESPFPNLLFAKDGEVYNFDGKRYIAIGGAFRVEADISACFRSCFYETKYYYSLQPNRYFYGL